jgi:hypothetical protein
MRKKTGCQGIKERGMRKGKPVEGVEVVEG